MERPAVVGLEAGGDDDVLKNGDKIAQTQDAVVLEKMISQFLFSKASESKTDNKEADSKVDVSNKPADSKSPGTKSTELGDSPF